MLHVVYLIFMSTTVLHFQNPLTKYIQYVDMLTIYIFILYKDGRPATLSRVLSVRLALLIVLAAGGRTKLAVTAECKISDHLK